MVFGFDPLGRVVLLEGGRKPESAKNLWRIVLRFRSPRRWYRLLARGELAPLEQLAGSISNEDRVEISAARDNVACNQCYSTKLMAIGATRYPTGIGLPDTSPRTGGYGRFRSPLR